MARQFLGNIRKQYTTCQAADAKLHHWEVTKPPPVTTTKKGKNGKPITSKKPGKRPPKPTVPAYCPAPAASSERPSPSERSS